MPLSNCLTCGARLEATVVRYRSDVLDDAGRIVDHRGWEGNGRTATPGPPPPSASTAATTTRWNGAAPLQLLRWAPPKYAHNERAARWRIANTITKGSKSPRRRAGGRHDPGRRWARAGSRSCGMGRSRTSPRRRAPGQSRKQTAAQDDLTPDRVPPVLASRPKRNWHYGVERTPTPVDPGDGARPRGRSSSRSSVSTTR
jgi:hypothetical protein